ncbi:MAG: sulfite exporter TauE/SafE family protein [Nitrospira sp.]|nr:sulfite exporter TauE/SafE family protein [Nitrospira sp.]
MSILGHEQTGLALLSGALVGLSLGLTGAGGSLLAIPLLVYVLKLGLHEATTISLLLLGLSAALSLVGYFRTGDVKVRPALVFSPTGAVGAWLGALGQQLVRSEIFLLSFSLLMMVMAIVGRWLSTEITAKMFAALTIGVAVILMFDNAPKVFTVPA